MARAGVRAGACIFVGMGTCRYVPTLVSRRDSGWSIVPFIGITDGAMRAKITAESSSDESGTPSACGASPSSRCTSKKPSNGLSSATRRT